MAEDKPTTPPAPWPTRPDGTPMRLGEMTPAQRREQFQAAAQRACERIRKRLSN